MFIIVVVKSVLRAECDTVSHFNVKRIETTVISSQANMNYL